MADEIEDWIQAPLSIPSCPVANNVDPPSDDWRKKSTSSVPDCSDTFNTRKTMTEWQQQCGTINERDDYILKHRLWTDLTITVGNVETGIKIFEAHRLMLSKSSAVFARMLYKQGNVFEEETTISLPDIRPELFEFVLKKMYGETLDIESAETAKAVLTLMKTFDLSINDDEQCWQHLSTDEINDIIGEHPAKKRKVKRKPVRAWQKEADTMAKRDKHILVKRIWTDCTFRVGENNCKTFHAHRIVLSKTSPVFAAMLFSELAKKGEVVDIPDVTPKAFSCFLSYAYEGYLEVSFEDLINSGDIWDFLYLAKKYLLPDRLIAQCRFWIFCKVYSDSFWTLEKNLRYYEMELHSVCRLVLQERTKFVLQVPSFVVDAKEECLMWLLKQEDLWCHEIDLYEAFISWAKEKLKLKGKPINPENMKKTLGFILKFIRFTTMTPQQFLRGPEKSGLFSTDTCFQILKYINDPKNEPYPEGFNSYKARNHFGLSKDTKTKVYIAGCHPDDIETVLKTYTNNTYENLFSNPACPPDEPCKCWLSGVKIKSQVKPEGCRNDYYDERITLMLCRGKGEHFEVIERSQHAGKEKYNSELDVAFRRPVNICSIEQNKLPLYLLVIPENSGFYPYANWKHWNHRDVNSYFKGFCQVYQAEKRGFIVGNAYSNGMWSIIGDRCDVCSDVDNEDNSEDTFYDSDTYDIGHYSDEDSFPYGV